MPSLASTTAQSALRASSSTLIPGTHEAKLRWFLVPLTAAAWIIFLVMNMMARGVLFRHKAASLEDKVSATIGNHSIDTAGEPLLGDTVDRLFTFVQISDLHISRYNTHGGLPHVQAFFKNELPLIGPDLVLVTGDLIDAKTKSKLVSVQYMDEWLAYVELLNVSGVALRNNGTFYWDMRGNHDCFNLGKEFNETEFGLMSAVKTEGYRYLHKKSFGTYDFLGIDLCPAIGTARPFNFFGTMDGSDMDTLASVIDAAKLEHRNHTFVASHYPTAVTVSGKSEDGRSLSQLASAVSVWMSGHLHQLVLGLGRTMYAYHRTPGMLELELGDMKDHAIYRIVAVDNDMISFTDEIVSLPQIPAPAPPLPEPSSTALLQEEEASLPSTSKNEPHPIPPVIVVTNPRDARFASPSREPIHRILSSTHIRILIYSRSTVASSNITITIDGNSVMKGAYRAAGSEFHPAWPAKLPLDSESSVNHLPLWVAPWNPTLYADGIDHIMKVEVMDGEGGKTIKMVVFRVDGNRSRKQMGLAKSGTLILSVRFPLLFQTLFAFAHFFITIILLLLPGLVVTHHRSDGTLAGLRGSIIRRLRWLDSLLERFNEGKPWIKIMQCCRKPHLRGGGTSILDASNATPVSAGTSSLDDDEDLMSGLGIGVAANGSGWWWSGSGDGVQESSAIGARAEEERPPPLTSFLGILGTLCERWLLTLWYGLLALADTPSLYYPLYIFSLQSAIGPWFFGDFVSSASLWWPNRYGILFTVGIWFGMGKGWIPLADSWIYSLWLVSLVLFPIVLYMSMLASRRTGWMHSRMSGSPSIVLRILLVVFIFYTLKDGIIMGYSYGWISVVTGSRIWWTLWAAFEMARRWVNPNAGEIGETEAFSSLASVIGTYIPGMGRQADYAIVGTDAAFESPRVVNGVVGGPVNPQSVLIWQAEEGEDAAGNEVDSPRVKAGTSSGVGDGRMRKRN